MPLNMPDERIARSRAAGMSSPSRRSRLRRWPHIRACLLRQSTSNLRLYYTTEAGQENSQVGFVRHTAVLTTCLVIVAGKRNWLPRGVHPLDTRVEAENKQIDVQLAEIRRMLTGALVPSVTARTKWRWSAAGRRRIAEAAKKRWVAPHDITCSGRSIRPSASGWQVLVILLGLRAAPEIATLTRERTAPKAVKTVKRIQGCCGS